MIGIDPTIFLAAAEAGEAPPGQRALLLVRAFSLSGMHLGVLLSLAACALLVLVLAPERHARAALGAAARPLASWLLGCLLLLLAAGALALLLKAGIVIGRPLLASLLFAGLAAGVSVVGRCLAARVLEDRGALAQTAVGAGIVVLTLACPIGLVVLAVAGPLGLGALCLARRSG
jgi:hypothetical protein